MADQKSGVPRGQRISRLLILANDGAERFYRQVESLLQRHGPRVMAVRLQADAEQLGGLLYGPGRAARLLMIVHKAAVGAALMALADRLAEELKAAGRLEEAREIFAGQPYKIELIDGLEQVGTDEYGEPIEGPVTISTYKQDKFEDLCRGPHVANTKEINPKAISITFREPAGAYWRGDENREMLTRIYGTAFETATELEEYLHMLEEAKKRDHRVLGQKLGLFLIDPLVGSGITPLIGTDEMGNGHLIVRAVGQPLGWIAEWDAGVEFYYGAGQFAGGRRMLFCAGARGTDGSRKGEFNLTTDGQGQQVAAGLVVDLTTVAGGAPGVPSPPVLDSSGAVIIQLSNASIIRIPPPPGQSSVMPASGCWWTMPTSPPSLCILTGEATDWANCSCKPPATTSSSSASSPNSSAGCR